MSTTSESYAILDFFKQLQYVPLWKKAMKNVKERAALPDTKHRRGLKEAQDKFDAIRARLDVIYVSAQRCGNIKKMASVVVLVSQMCVDTLLSSKFMAAGQYFSIHSSRSRAQPSQPQA
ncbi:hypothetical protein LXA43DRAFT_1099673 [Ganoderma leucocontextum]|nr:hypothetical protein LXA43DRAFT_1099673 [Ganoderma leucocontextum]